MNIAPAPIGNGWRVVRLGDVADVTAPLVDPSSQDFSALPQIGGEDVAEGGMLLSVPGTARQKGIRATNYNFTAGDVLFLKLRPYLRKCIVAPFDGLCSTELLPLRVKPDMADPEFLRLSLLSEPFSEYCNRVSKGSRMPRIGPRDLLSWSFAIPSVDEQRRIVAALEEVRARTSYLQRKLAEEAETLHKANRSLMDRQLDQLQSKYGLKRLAAYSKDSESFRDGPFGSNLKTSHYAPCGARVVRLQNIGDGEFLDSDKAFVTLKHYEIIERHNVHEGDVVVACLGDGARAAGRACVIPGLGGPALVKADCFRVRLPPEAILPAYLTLCLNSASVRRRFGEQMRGATRPRVNLGMVRNAEIPAAPLPVQREVISRTSRQRSATSQAATAQRAMQVEIQNLNQALLRAAFSGAL